MSEFITLVETPRDAFQGLKRFIPTKRKISYIASLLDGGFKHIDLGSFVSPKAVPQMADSERVVAAFASRNDVERIGIVLNEMGLRRAFLQPGIDTIGFPFSLSDGFQRENSGKSIEQTWPVFNKLIQETLQNKRSFILYLSMAFGTSYKGDAPWSEEGLLAFIQMLATASSVRHISLADTVAAAKPKQVAEVFKVVRREFPSIEFSAHFHGTSRNWMRNVDAALDAGCRRFDCAAGGLGGCPFACDDLIANIPSEKLVERLEANGFQTGVDLDKIKACAKVAREFQKQYA